MIKLKSNLPTCFERTFYVLLINDKQIRNQPPTPFEDRLITKKLKAAASPLL